MQPTAAVGGAAQLISSDFGGTEVPPPLLLVAAVGQGQRLAVPLLLLSLLLRRVCWKQKRGRRRGLGPGWGSALGRAQ